MKKLLTNFVNWLIKFTNTNEITDGFHTFSELYDHRQVLFVELLRENKNMAWWSDRHSDGSLAFGYPYVIAGINTKAGCQITYHIDIGDRGCTGSWIREILNKEIKKVDFAPIWDRHTSSDVLFRLHTQKYKMDNKQSQKIADAKKGVAN